MANKGNLKRTFRGGSMQGCLNCRDRHTKCDEGKSICQNWVKVNRECVQKDGSGALPLSTSSDPTAANTPNTTPAKSWAAGTTVGSLSIVAEEDNTSESAEAANTIGNTNSEPLNKYKESEIDSPNHDHDINNHVQNIDKLGYPQTSVMDKNTVSKPNPALSPTSSDKNVPKSTTIAKPSEQTMSTTKESYSPTPGAKFIPPLSLTSAITNRHVPPNCTPLKPIYH